MPKKSAPAKGNTLKSKPTALPLGLAVLAVAAATGGAVYFQNRHPQLPVRTVAATPTPASSPDVILPEAPPTPDTHAQASPIIFRVTNDQNGSHLKQIHLSASDAVGPTGTPPAVNALNLMAAGDDSPLPPGTQALSYREDTATKTATVDFNQAFVKNFPGGDTAEALAIESILATIGQFGPEHVQITVEGKKIDSLGGNQSLLSPLPVPQTATGTQTAQNTENGGTAP